MGKITEKYYEGHIPKCCRLKTIAGHKDIMLCWGLLCDMERGIDTTNRECGRECDEHINHDPILLKRILSTVADALSAEMKEKSNLRLNTTGRKRTTKRIARNSRRRKNK